MESSSGPIHPPCQSLLLERVTLVDSSLPANSLLAVARKMVAYMPASRKS